jgi:hypothetical protein
LSEWVGVLMSVKSLIATRKFLFLFFDFRQSFW